MADEVIDRYKSVGNYENSFDIAAIIGDSRLKYEIDFVNEATIMPDGRVKVASTEEEFDKMAEEYAGAGTSSQIAMYASSSKSSVSYHGTLDEEEDEEKKEEDEKEE